MAYEITLVMTNKLNLDELKKWSIRFGKFLERLGAKDFLLKYHGKQKLKYFIKNNLHVSFLQVNFDILPEYLENIRMRLKFDSNVIRFLIFKTNQK